MQVPDFKLLLPVGISFYTFQALGYTIDVYRGNVKAEKSLFTYALFVSFFPQLVAGPIERAGNLIGQFKEKHHFDGSGFIDGVKMMVWGYFMKLCIAENVAPYVNAVFNNIDMHNGTSILMASFFYTFQIYCDFCGYSLIAIGTARCLGFRLMDNFNHPYLSRSVKEFWRRWHISLSLWLRDYVYFPLGGSRCSEIKHQRNIIVTMLLSGIWHGANWNFVLWGTYHALLLCMNSLKRKISWMNPKRDNLVIHLFDIFICFSVIMVGRVVTRANDLSDAFAALGKIISDHGMLYNGEGKPAIVLPLLLIALLMGKEIKDELGLNIHLMHNKRLWVSALSTTVVLVAILLCAQFDGGQFIYFQF